MEKRSKSIFGRFRRPAYFLIAAVVIYALLCQYIGKVFIPRVLIPKVRAYLESGNTGPLLVSVGDIDFVPASGFLLKDVRLYTKRGSPSDYIVSSKAVDIDLAWFDLLFKRVTIRRFDITDAELNVYRGSDGLWNVGPLASMGMGDAESKHFGGFQVTVKELRLLGGKARYSDRLVPENSIEKTYDIAYVSVTGSDDGSRIILSTKSTGPKKGSLKLALEYSPDAEPRGKGSMRINTPNINEYWSYYIDDLIKPWELKVGDTELKADISFSPGVFRMEGVYGLKDGEITYGDLHISADCVMKHTFERLKGRSVSYAELVLKGMEISAGDNVMVSGAECRAYLDKDGVDISAIEGMAFNKPVSYKGMFIFGDPKRLSVDGQVCGIRNALDMEISGPDKASSVLQVFTSYSKLTVKASSNDLKGLVFDIGMAGDIDLSDIGRVAGLMKREMSGKASVSGTLSGELDRTASFNGMAGVKVDNFTLFDMTPKSFSIKATVKDGLADCEAPKFPIYEGTAAARVKFDAGLSPQKWGFSFDLEKCDLSSLSLEDARLAGMKGHLDANIACSGVLGQSKTAIGGGYVKITDCNIKGVPLFIAVEKGMNTVIKDFVLPDFKEIRAGFDVADGNMAIRSACQSPMIKIEMSGNCDFSGNVDMTAGANVSRLSPIKTARQILIPATLGFDFVKDGIMIKISGKWPELKQQTIIKPLRVFDEVFGFMKNMELRRYFLDDTWAKVVKLPE
ncbi:MAG: hypothetical protein PHE80_02810 [Candidatus Omnitrophica bacterium]|nr:hypothetical protein [Candidatus Omnitrophota bacterium]